MQFNNDFLDDLSRSPKVMGMCVEKAEEIAAAARASAPVDSGAYRDSIHVETKYQERAVALVVSSDSKTMLIEAQSGNLARALRSVKNA